MALDINGYNSTFKSFVQFAEERMSANDAKAVLDAKVNLPGDRKIVAISKSETDEVHKFFRTSDEHGVNDRTRDIFKNAVFDMFGGEAKIPASVKKAMLLSDYNCGKPLTARRIMAVKAAIDADGTTRALAAREAVVRNHSGAEPGSDEAMLVAAGGRFTASEVEFAKGLAVVGHLRNMSKGLSPTEQSRIWKNFNNIGLDGAKMFETMYRMALEVVAHDGAADLNAGAALFVPGSNAVVRLATLEYTGSAAFKAIVALPAEKRIALARILDRFLGKFQPEPRPDGRVVVQDDFVLRLAANIDRLAKLDSAGKLDAKELVKTCYPEVAKPRRFQLGNAMFANVDNLESVRKFRDLVRLGKYYSFEDEKYIDAINNAAQELRSRLGEDFVPDGANLNTLVRGQDLVKDIAGLVDEAIAENREVDVDAFGQMAASRMFPSVVEQRIGKVMEEIGESKGVTQPGTTMASQLLARQPELLDAFRSATTPAEANAALASMRGAMEAAVERERDLRALMAPAIDKAAAILAEKLGITPDKAKAQVRFQDRLVVKLRDLVANIQRGQQPGCREPGFDPRPLFEDVAQKIAGEYIAKFDEIDAMEGASVELKNVWKRDISLERKPTEFNMAKIARLGGKLDVAELSAKLADPQASEAEKIAAIKRFCDGVDAAGRETFEEWGEFGADEKNSTVQMALKPALLKTPGFQPLLANIFANEDNVLFRALPEVGERQYVVVQLRDLAMEP